MKPLYLLISLLLAVGLQAQVKVASLHPLMGDLARQVGGERVTVLDVGKAGMNVHSFSPSAKDLQSMGSCELVVASGKGLESYLPSLENSMKSVPILEVGKSIPSRELTGEEEGLEACDCGGEHSHSHGSIDPHWWHDVGNMERAVKVMEKQLVKIDPEGKAYYQMRSKETRGRYQKLERWVKAQVATIPQEQRKLVTAHAAFGYFCQAYHMKPVFVLGLSGDHEVPAQELAKEVTKLKAEGVRSVFPEKTSNPKVLAQVAKQAGASVGGPLIADGAFASYEGMMQQNVTAIVKGLTGK